MTAEIAISSVVVLVCIAPIIIIGIVRYRSKEPVGFWSGKKPPRKEQLTDVINGKRILGPQQDIREVKNA